MKWTLRRWRCRIPKKPVPGFIRAVQVAPSLWIVDIRYAQPGQSSQLFRGFDSPNRDMPVLAQMAPHSSTPCESGIGRGVHAHSGKVRSVFRRQSRLRNDQAEANGPIIMFSARHFGVPCKTSHHGLIRSMTVVSSSSKFVRSAPADSRNEGSKQGNDRRAADELVAPPFPSALEPGKARSAALLLDKIRDMARLMCAKRLKDR